MTKSKFEEYLIHGAQQQLQKPIDDTALGVICSVD